MTMTTSVKERLCFRLIFAILVVLSTVSSKHGIAQEYYTLKVPGAQTGSTARIGPEELVVRDPSGQETVYSRLRRYDTPDGQFLGYGSRQAQRVIQWPTSNQGNMRIGTLRNGQIEFAPSKMAVLGRDPNLQSGLSPDSQEGQINKTVILSAGEPGSRLLVRSNRQGQLQLVPMAPGGAQADELLSAWTITPVGGDMVRIQQSVGNQWLALGTDPQMAGGFGNGVLAQNRTRSQVRLVGISNSISQCWRLQPFQGGYCFESVAMPGFGLTCVPNNGLWLQQIVYSPWQIWWPQQPTFALPQPGYRVLNEQIIQNAPLPPVSLRISNTHSDALLVLLADRRNPSALKKFRIPQGGSETVVLDRDSGSTVIQTVQWLDGFGNWDRREIQVPVPPAVLYDVSVYEEFLQSIAIDATGKSPNVIEDVNYQPRSVGFLLLPPGDQLQDNSVIDVYRAAFDSQNPGAVRRLAPSDYNRSSSQGVPADPLKDLLEQLQSKRGAF